MQRTGLSPSACLAWRYLYTGIDNTEFTVCAEWIGMTIVAACAISWPADRLKRQSTVDRGKPRQTDGARQ